MKHDHPADLLKRTLASKAEIQGADDFDIVDVVPIPMHGDRMVRLRTLEEALNDFDSSGESGELPLMGYFVQVKPRKPQKIAASRPSSDLFGTPVHTISVPSLTSDEPARPVAGPRAPASLLRDDEEPELLPSPARRKTSSETTQNLPIGAISGAPGLAESIYLPDGKLNLPYLMHTAEVLFNSGDYALARNIYKAIISSGEKTSTALLGVARCYEAEQKLEEAHINYEESIAYHPQPEAYKGLISLLIRQKKDQQAAEVIERALHHRQLDTSLRYELCKTAGNCWARLNNLRDSERYYKKALEVRPDADEIRTNLGTLYLQNNRIEEAERHFNDALASNPQSHQALMGLGSCALAEGNKLAAHAWFARSLQVELRNPTAIFHLVKCAYEIKSYTVAAKVLEDYIQVAPINIHLLYSLAGLQFHLGRMHDARETCLRIHQLHPGHSGARDLLDRIEGISSAGDSNR